MAKGKQSKRKPKRKRSATARDQLVVVTRDEATGFLTARDGSDLGNPYRQQHQGGLLIKPRSQTAGGMVIAYGAVALGDSFLMALFNTGRLGPKHLSRARLTAAERLLANFRKAGLKSSTTANYDGAGGGGRQEMSKSQEKAYQAYMDDIRSLPPAIGRLIAGVVCYDQRISESMVPQLCMGLDLLCAGKEERQATKDRIAAAISRGKLILAASAPPADLAEDLVKS